MLTLWSYVFLALTHRFTIGKTIQRVKSESVAPGFSMEAWRMRLEKENKKSTLEHRRTKLAAMLAAERDQFKVVIMIQIEEKIVNVSDWRKVLCSYMSGSWYIDLYVMYVMINAVKLTLAI